MVTNKHYLTALQEHQSGNLELAEKLYRECLSQNPTDPEVLHLLGILLAERQDFSGSLQFLTRALEVGPGSAALHNSIGNVLQYFGQYQEAMVHYQQALQLQPVSASLHNNLGNVYYRLGELVHAKKHYTEAIRLRPNYVDAHYNLSLGLIKEGLVVEAMENLELVLKLQPEHGPAHTNLAYLLQSQGQLELAIEHYKKSLEFDPQDTGVLHNLGVIFLLQNKFREALPYFLRLSHLSNSFDACYNLGVIYSGLGSPVEAIGYFEQALAISPNDYASNVNLGAIYLEKREFDLAEQYYLKVAKLYPKDEGINYILAAIQQKAVKSKAPEAYIKDLFGQYAPYFDRHLEALGYQVPQLLFEAVQAELDREGKSSWAVLDLGCGTGMAGACFKTRAQRLIGIDISESMLEVAKGKQIYTELLLDSIEEGLDKVAAIDIIVAADSLVYFGELQEIFAKCYVTLNPGGVFAFTTEINIIDNSPYLLQRSARFAHSDSYIKGLAEQNNFTILRSDRVILRKQGDKLVDGWLFLFKKMR